VQADTGITHTETNLISTYAQATDSQHPKQHPVVSYFQSVSLCNRTKICTAHNNCFVNVCNSWYYCANWSWI